MIVNARYGRACTDCDATADQRCAETCPAQQAIARSAAVLRTHRTGLRAPEDDEAANSADTPTAPQALSSWLGKSDGLSANEGAIVALIVLGLSNQEIASALHKSPRSVTTCIRSAYRKMGVTNRPQAVAWGNLHGLRLTAGAAQSDKSGPR